MAIDFNPKVTSSPTTTGLVNQLTKSPTARLLNQPSAQTSGTTPNSTVTVSSTPNYQNAMSDLAGIVSTQQESANAALQNAAAQKLAQQGAGASVGTTPVGSLESVPYKGPHNVQQWVDNALEIMGLGKKFEPGVEDIIMHESSNNPNAVNNWDSNAKAGHPSQGLMQTTPGTFAEYALPGYNQNILDPVSNIIAGVRYALSRYGKGMVLAGGRHNSADKYEGY